MSNFCGLLRKHELWLTLTFKLVSDFKYIVVGFMISWSTMPKIIGRKTKNNWRTTIDVDPWRMCEPKKGFFKVETIWFPSSIPVHWQMTEWWKLGSYTFLSINVQQSTLQSWAFAEGRNLCCNRRKPNVFNFIQSWFKFCYQTSMLL